MTQLPNQPIAFVTGAGSGIGRAIAQTLAHHNSYVIVADIDATGGRATAEAIQTSGGQAEFIQVDVTQSSEVDQSLGEIVSRLGRVDYAINNAGIEGPPLRTADTGEDAFDRIMAVNVKGVWLCMKYELQQMLRQGHGCIVNIASVAGLVGAHSMPIYSASKHAVVGLTKSAAVEYAHKNIRINAVCPAIIHTAMVDRAFAHMPQLEKAALANNPSHRLGQPQEVANAVAWLCSDQSSFTNGATLTVDGGFTAQ